MGLDVTHDCWTGAYSAFMRWRIALAQAVGYSDFCADAYQRCAKETWLGVPVPPEEHAKWCRLWEKIENERPALYELLWHSDCDGEIEVPLLVPMAEELEFAASNMNDDGTDGHIRDGMKSTTLRFAAGLRAAAEAGEPVRFQ